MTLAHERYRRRQAPSPRQVRFDLSAAVRVFAYMQVVLSCGSSSILHCCQCYRIRYWPCVEDSHPLVAPSPPPYALALV